MKMYKLWRICVAIATTCYCQQSFAFSHAPEYPQDYYEWSIAIISPSFYPVKVSESYGVYEKEDRTVLMHTFLGFFGATKLTGIRSMIPDYDGFGLPLLTDLARIHQIGEVKKLPDSIYIYWVSLYNQRFFATKFDIPDSVKQRALVKTARPYSPNVACYENTLYFGLLPNGQAKVWQGGCDRFTFLEELAPATEQDQDINGFDASVYKEDFYQDIQQRAQAEGITLDPIPWDKLNRTFTYDRQKAMDAYLERMKAKVHQPKAASSQP